ncbi:penicillin acylase family protein [Brevibacterium sp. 2SA]|uniref:penicillin acylase family protein n=1 Tax=Brevibacterium sp. 2SA TaxID=2502198 RepID=UPI0010F4DEEE|nr:penicillin acylase family protein [Brevibacterium sp. 2SA]
MAAAEPDAPSALESAMRPPSGTYLHLSRRIVLRVVAGLVVLVLLAVLLGIVVVRRSFPTTDGEISLPGLDAQVTVTRDGSGIPMIEASTAHDLFLAQGFVHAQDRFWEMDFRRKVTAGRLSEYFGPSQYSTDAFIRTLGWRKVAEEEVAQLDETTLGYYEAYAEGVNAYLKDRSPTEVSLEYGILGLQAGPIEIEEWTPADSVAWLKAMAWDLRSNLEDEIDRAITSAALTEEQMADIYPDYPYDERPTIIDGPPGDAPPAPADDPPEGQSATGGTTDSSDDPAATSEGNDGDPATTSAGDDGSPQAGGSLTPGSGPATGPVSDGTLPESLGELDARLREIPGLLGMNSRDIGSNSWVVSGALTDTGAPLLANDPHLSPAMPSVWYQVGLRCSQVTPACPFDVSGFSFSGLPGVVIGHNQSIAWGMTNLGPDVTDLVVEKIDDADAIYDDERERVVTRQETIRIAKEESRTMTVWETKHGPIVSSLDDTYRTVLDSTSPTANSGLAGARYQLALEWTALTPGRTASAIFALNRATNWEEFRAAAELFDVPSQNLVYADVEGNIGYQAPGKIPRRGTADGMLPRQGWDSGQDWQGWIDFDELPSALNPERGWIVTANNPVTRPGESERLGDDYDDGDRATRITDLLTEAIAAGPVSADDFAAIQGDDLNPLADTLVPRLLALDANGDPDIEAAQEMLRTWDGRDAADSAAAAYFNVVVSTILAEVFAPKLPPEVRPSGGSRWYLVIDDLLTEPQSPWWTDAEVTGRDEALTRALRSSWTRTADLLGPEPVTWRWGTLHELTIRNASLGESGITAVEKLFNRGPFEVSGGSGVVNATGWDAAVGFETDWVPSMRQIIDVGDFDRSRWINLTGASGHAFNPNYADQTEDWAANRTRPWAYSPQAVAAAAEDTLVLTP